MPPRVIERGPQKVAPNTDQPAVATDKPVPPKDCLGGSTPNATPGMTAPKPVSPKQTGST